MRRIRGGRKEAEEDEGRHRRRMRGGEIEEEEGEEEEEEEVEEVQGEGGLHYMYCSRQENRRETRLSVKTLQVTQAHYCANRPNTVCVCVLHARRLQYLSSL